MRILPLSVLALLVLCAAPYTLAQTVDTTPPATVRLGLDEAIRLALRVSPEVGAAQADARFASARFAEARASRFLTDFKATTAHSIAPGLSIPEDNTQPTDALYLNPDVRNRWDTFRPFNRVQVELIQPIWTWGELGGTITAARYGAQLEDAKVAAKRREVALRLGESYYGLLLANQLQRLARETGGIVDRAKVEIQRLLEEGKEGVDYADLYQVQLTEQEYLRRVVEVRERQATASMALRRQLFLPDAQTFLPLDTTLTPLSFTVDSLDVYFSLALQNRPELAQARAGLAAREALVRVARSNYYPKLALGVTATYAYASGRYRQRNPFINEPFLSRSVQPGFGLRQQLNFGQTRARVQQAEAQANSVRYQQEAAEQLVLFEVEEAYRNLRVAEAALEALDASFTITRQWLLDEQLNFDLDLGDTENLVRAVQAKLTTEAAYYEAIQRRNVAVLRLLSATGVLVDTVLAGTLVD